MTEPGPWTGAASRTPADRCHRGEGAMLVECGGWHVPLHYSNAVREEAALRAGIALADLSACAKVGFQGRGVGDAIAALGARPELQPREVAWLDTARTGLACRLTCDSLLVLATATDDQAVKLRLAAVPDSPMLFQHDVTSAYAAFGLLGSRIESVLQRLSSAHVAPSAFRPGTCMETNFAGVHAVLIRPDRMAVPFVWICVAWDVGEYVWQTLRDSDAGLEPVGMEAWRKVIQPPAS
jgi:glycine cleavage system aminomethyltransferase T